MGNKKQKVLLIGWDAADWKIINPLIDSGKMPTLKHVVENGTIGNIMTLEPPLSPMLWTSIATGKTAEKHGILGFAEPDPVNGGIRYVEVTSRKCKAIWNILHHEGLKSNVINWWPSYPAEPINGVYVANSFLRFSENPETPLALLKGSLFPDEYYKHLPRFKVHPTELTEQHLLPFFPLLEKMDTANDMRVSAVVKEIANSATLQAVSTFLLEETSWDFFAVYFDSIDHLCHGFMKFHPPQLQGVPDKEYQLYNNVVNSIYMFYDMMLERLLQLAGKDTVVVIVSDHGFKSDNTRMISIPDMPSSPALDHRSFGVFCMYGPNIKKDERVYGASLLDVTPTILSIMGLPIGKDMDGKVLLNCFENPVQPTYIDSWEDIEGDFGIHKKTTYSEDLYASAEALQQLIELGYVADYGDDKKKAFEMAKAEQEYNLAQSLVFSGQQKAALPHFRNALALNPDDERFNYSAADCLIQLKNVDEAQKIIEHVKNIKDKKLIFNYDFLEGLLFAEKGDSASAIDCFLRAEKAEYKPTHLFLQLGKQYLKIKDYSAANEMFDKALKQDDDSYLAYHGKGLCLLFSDDFENAIDCFLKAIGLVYHFAPSHYYLGISLLKTDHLQEAAQAFEISLVMAPKNIKARKHLIKLYSDFLNNKDRAEYHLNQLEKYSKGKVTIVSGLPRSGTSLMMQILDAAGLEVLTDHAREADENNPKGYFEYEPVKNLARDNSWLSDASGKCVKIITQLVRYLPVNCEYKIIYMKRDIVEIVTSQQKMLGKSLKSYPVTIDMAFRREEEFLMKHVSDNSNIDMLIVNYSDLINNSSGELSKIEKFLDIEFDKDHIVNNVIDASLYRNKVN